MQVFGVIFRQLVESGIAGPGSVFVPDMLPSRQLLHLAHGRDYVDDLLTGRVSPDVTRRIGFYDAVNTPLLIERSLSGDVLMPSPETVLIKALFHGHVRK